MAHNSRLKSDAYYVDGVVPDATWWAGIDAAQNAAINGDAGGTWTPSTLIVLTGEVWAAGAWQANVASGLYTPAGSGKRIVLGDSDYFTLESGHSARSRNLVTPFGRFRDTSSGTSRATYDTGTDGCLFNLSGNAQLLGARTLLPLEVHNGALLSIVNLDFVVVDGHAGGVPSSMPLYRVVRMAADGTLTPLRTTSLGDGWVQIATPASGSAWHASGATQTVSYVTDGGALCTIDTSLYAYFVEVIDEQGTNAMGGNTYLSAVASFASIADLRPQ